MCELEVFLLVTELVVLRHVEALKQTATDRLTYTDEEDQIGTNNVSPIEIFIWVILKDYRPDSLGKLKYQSCDDDSGHHQRVYSVAQRGLLCIAAD